MRLTDNQLQFLAGFSKRPEWLMLCEILDAQENDALNLLLRAQGEEVYRAQGAMKALVDFKTAVVGAQKRLERGNPPRLVR